MDRQHDQARLHVADGDVVGDDHEAPGGVDREIHRVLSACALLVQLGYVPGLRVDAKGTDLAAVAVDRVERTLGDIEGEERRVYQVA